MEAISWYLNGLLSFPLYIAIFLLSSVIYKKKIITEDVYKKVNEKLLKLIEICKTRNKPINDSG